MVTLSGHAAFVTDLKKWLFYVTFWETQKKIDSINALVDLKNNWGEDETRITSIFLGLMLMAFKFNVGMNYAA